MSAFIKPVPLALLVFEFSHNVSYSYPMIALHCSGSFYVSSLLHTSIFLWIEAVGRKSRLAL